MKSLLSRFDATLTPTETDILTSVQEYIAWQVGRQETEFNFTNDDDIDLRAYLLHLRVKGHRRKDFKRKLLSLQRFYQWAEEQKLIETNPFNDLDFNRPLLGPDEIKRRKETLPDDPYDREVARLKALNELAQLLNQAVNVENTLEVMLAKLTKVMGVPTAWVYLLQDIYTSQEAFANRSPYTLNQDPWHDFALANARGLPPGLEYNDRFFLRQSPDCQCQALLRKGRLVRAVNIVECTRCQDALKAGGDNRGLMFHASAPLIVSGQVLGIINVATDEWQFFTTTDLQFLSTVGAQVAVALDRAHLYDLAQAQRARLEWELKMAREVQAKLMPETLPDIPGYRLAAFWESAREVAGDFYDFWQLADGRWALVIADVCDKGAPAAMYMAMTRTLIRSSAGQFNTPADVLMAVNTSFKENSNSSMFVTVFYGILDPSAGTLSYANAGHDPPLVCRQTSGMERLMPTGPLIGIFDKYLITDKVMTFAPGDTFVAYTDGVTDAVNARFEGYGIERLMAVVSTACETANIVLENLLGDLAAFTGDTPQSDDITLLVLKREAVS